MAKVTFKEDICKGCGLCVDACPKKLLIIAKDKINKKGHSPAQPRSEGLWGSRNSGGSPLLWQLRQ